jgi:hypothetical protein
MKKALLLVLIVSLFFSCSSFVYYPNGANAPLLEKKNDLRLGLGIKGASGYVRSAYAITDHLGVQLNINYLNVNDPDAGTDRRNSNYYAEAAAGYYKQLQNNFILEGYVGYGHGACSSIDPVDASSDIINSKHYKIYAQVDAGFKWKYFNFGLALREAYVNVYQAEINGLASNAPQMDLFFEPIFFLAIGPEKFKVNAQVGFSDSQFSSIINYAPFIVSLGLEAKFSLAKPKAE